MTYGIYNLLMNILGIACIAILVAFVFARIIYMLFSFVSKSECTGECNQGRNCTCQEKKDV